MADVTKAWNVEDLRRMAAANVPKLFFDYLEGGANSETTMQSNRTDFTHWALKQRALSGIEGGTIDLGTVCLGQPQRLPILLAPVGYAGLYCRRGEIVAGRAADEAGIALCRRSPSRRSKRWLGPGAVRSISRCTSSANAS
jgi:L-lactate dehydrogenase (cytochrome)